MPPAVFHYDYEFSPYGQKTKLLLHALGVPFKRVDVPPVLPRADLESLGISYRRIPVLSVGKDVYCDSSLMFDLLLNKSNGLATKDVKYDRVVDHAWESWGLETFQNVLTLAPAAVLTEHFVKDRETVFPILARPDYKQLRGSGLAELQSRMTFIENEVLTKGTFAHGNDVSVADMHIIFSIRWVLKDLGVEQEKGFGKQDFPKVWKLIDSLPEVKPEVVTGEDAKKTILGSEYFAPEFGVQKDDPLGFEQGTNVVIESLDTTPNSHPQGGKLLGTSTNEIVLGLDNGIRLHFPRQGYVVKKA